MRCVNTARLATLTISRGSSKPPILAYVSTIYIYIYMYIHILCIHMHMVFHGALLCKGAPSRCISCSRETQVCCSVLQCVLVCCSTCCNDFGGRASTLFNSDSHEVLVSESHTCARIHTHTHSHTHTHTHIHTHTHTRTHTRTNTRTHGNR